MTDKENVSGDRRKLMKAAAAGAGAAALFGGLGFNPLVAQALTLSSFIPEDQDRKLALIADADPTDSGTLTFVPAPGPAGTMLARPRICANWSRPRAIV